MREVTVYTVLSGNYDKLQKVNEESSVRFVCVTDKRNSEIESSGWELLIPENRGNLKGKNFNRYFKINAHILFSGLTLYVDANIKIEQPIGDFVRTVLNDSAFCIYRHPYRESLNQEVEECKQRGLISHRELVQLNRYLASKKIKLEHGKLTENNIIFRNLERLSNEDFAHWWSLYRDVCSRDQLTLEISSIFSRLEILEPKDIGYPFSILPHNPSKVKKLKNIIRKTTIRWIGA